MRGGGIFCGVLVGDVFMISCGAVLDITFDEMGISSAGRGGTTCGGSGSSMVLVYGTALLFFSDMLKLRRMR